jgi:4-amino-4-deoxy-L-arabinose transferase-like glycosyltransferase
MNNFKKIDLFLLLFLIVLGLVFRLYKINLPLADYHSWRQADTAAVGRNYAREEKINLLQPKYDDLSGIQSGKENPQGFRMVEFPLYQAVFAKLYLLYSAIPLEIYARLVSIIFTLLTIVAVYLLVLKSGSRTAAFFASFTLAMMPYMVFFTRVVLPEPTAVSLAILSILFLSIYIEQIKKPIGLIFYFLSIISFALSLLIKPTTIFYIFPLLFLFFYHYRQRIFTKIGFYLFFFLSIFPLFLWRSYIQRFPEGIPANDWLFTNVNTSEGLKNIFFRPSFFRWIFFERINNIILGGYLTFFFLLGILTKRKTAFFYSFLLTFFSYLFVFQGGNVQHEYYQIIIFPILSIFVGLGIDTLLTLRKIFINKFLLIFIILLLYVISFYFSYFKVKDYYSIPNNLINIASIIKTLTQQNDLLVTDTTGDTTLLYLCDRRGYPAVYKDLDYFKNLGVKYFVTDKKWVIEAIQSEQKYTTVFINNQFAIFVL